MLIYASSCQRYFLEHGEAFIRSAKRHGHEVMVDKTDDFKYYRGGFKSENTFALYLRYLRLPELLTQDVLMLDIDSIINEHIDPIDCDLALFFRPWIDDPYKKILMTASYWTPRAIPFAEALKTRVLAGPRDWYEDQIMVMDVHKDIGDQFRIAKLDQNFVNYSFDREAPIWTAKGPIRKSNPLYLERRGAC